jgi:hypothetical protein
VTSSPAGISCGTDCSQVYSPGTTVTLTVVVGQSTVLQAAASSSDTFGSWNWTGVCPDGQSSTTCTVTLNSGGTTSLTARFLD